MPVAVTLKLASWSATTEASTGCTVMAGATGAGSTVSVAADEVSAAPSAGVTTTRNCAPLSASCVAGVTYCSAFAPATSAHAPPAELRCHCRLAAPATPTRKAAPAPATTCTSAGWAVIRTAGGGLLPPPPPLHAARAARHVASKARQTHWNGRLSCVRASPRRAPIAAVIVLSSLFWRDPSGTRRAARHWITRCGPLELGGRRMETVPARRLSRGALERVMGIEPTYEAWEAAVLPLNYTRSETDSSRGTPA